MSLSFVFLVRYLMEGCESGLLIYIFRKTGCISQPRPGVWIQKLTTRSFILLDYGFAGQKPSLCLFQLFPSSQNNTSSWPVLVLGNEPYGSWPKASPTKGATDAVFIHPPQELYGYQYRAMSQTSHGPESKRLTQGGTLMLFLPFTEKKGKGGHRKLAKILPTSGI